MQPCHSRPTLGCRLYAWDFHPWEKRSKTPRFCTQSVHTHRKNNPSKKPPHPTLGNRFLWTLLKQIFSPILVPENVSNEKSHVESMCWTLFYWLRLPKRVRSKFADYDCFDIAWGILWPCGTQNTAYQHSEPPWMSKTRVSGPIWTQCWMGYWKPQKGSEFWSHSGNEIPNAMNSIGESAKQFAGTVDGWLRNSASQSLDSIDRSRIINDRN